MIGEVDSFAIQASGLQAQLAGDLNIGCFTPIAPHILPVILKKLTKNYPGISIHLHEGHLRRVQEFLLDGTVDVVLSYDLGLSDSVATTILGQAPPHVILPKGDPLARKKKIDLRELREKPMILLDLPESRGYFELMFKTVGVQANIAHRTETYEMVRSMVGAGLGFSLLNLRPLIDNTYTGSEVVCIPLSNKIVSPNLILGQRKRETPTKLVEAFAASCRQYFQSPQANQHMVIT